MKISLLTLTLIFLSSVTFSQKLQLNKHLSLSLPKSAEVLNVSKIAAMKVDEKSILSTLNVGEKFKVDNIFIRVNSEESKVNVNHLKNLEKGLKEMIGWGKPPFFESNIKTVNGFEALIVAYELNEATIGHYSFFCVNSKNNNILSGQIEYKLGERNKAKNILNEMIESIKFQ